MLKKVKAEVQYWRAHNKFQINVLEQTRILNFNQGLVNYLTRSASILASGS